MRKEYDLVMFDLDGTVSRSHPGIIRSAQRAMEEHGWQVPEDFDYFRFIGPPIVQTYMEALGMPEQDALTCLQLYRKYYNAGEIFNTSLYPGIGDLIRELDEAGIRVCIATSKPQPMADRVIEYLGITDWITVNSGADSADRHSDKPGLIRRCLEETGIDPERAVMIGDTRFDAAGARDMKIDFIGVLYGYGSREEMEACSISCRFAENAQELREILLNGKNL